MNLETKITIYKFTPQVFTLPRQNWTKSCLICLIVDLLLTLNSYLIVNSED